MNLATLFSGFSVAGAIALLVIAHRVARMSKEELNDFGHDAAYFQPVLAGRYVPMGIFMIAAAVSQDLLVICLAVLALASAALIDYRIYRRDQVLKKPHKKVGFALAAAAAIILLLEFGTM